MKRTYPMACRSLLCGETSCPSACPHLPQLEDFRAWQRRTHARQPDPIWCPGVWEGSASDPPHCETGGRRPRTEQQESATTNTADHTDR